ATSTVEAETFVSKGPDQGLEVQEATNPIRLIHVASGQATESSFRVLRSELDARTERVRNPLAFGLVFVTKDDKAPTSSSSSACHAIFDGETRQIERQVKSNNCSPGLNRRVHHFFDKYAAFVKPKFQFILRPCVILLADICTEYVLLIKSKFVGIKD